MPDHVQPPLDSVDRALRLVEALREGQAMSVQDVSSLLGVAPSTAHRLLKALSFRQFAHQGDDRLYRAGPAIARATGGRHTAHELQVLAGPILETVRSEVGETAQMMIREGTQIRFIAGIESEHPLRVSARIDDLMPAHCSAGGKALLAELEQTMLQQLYAEGLPSWPTSTVMTLKALERHLQLVRRQGYGLNRDETESGVSGVGVAFHDRAGEAVGALTVAVPTARFTRADIPTYVDALTRAGDLVSRRLRTS